MLGTLIFAMSLQLDRRAAWNTMGPCLFAIVVMVTMWVRSWGRQGSCPDPLPWKLGYKSMGSPYMLTPRGQSVAPRSVHVLVPGSVFSTPAEGCQRHPQGPSVAWHPLTPSKQPTLAALGRALRCACGFPQVYRCGRRRHCYPPSWQRWVFYLLPGFSLAALALTIYTSMMTSENYYYTHSIWHMLLAGSAAFLLPPRDQHTEPWACAQKLTCHYEICKNHRDELYTVT